MGQWGDGWFDVESSQNPARGASDTALVQAALDAAMKAGAGTARLGQRPYVCHDLGITAPNVTLRGVGKRASILKRADGMDKVQLQITNGASTRIVDLGFDANGAKSGATNPHTIAFSDAQSHDSTVEGCAIVNSPGFAIWCSFNSSLLRMTNLRVIDNDITALANMATDLVAVTSQGGTVRGNRLSFQSGLALNIYEANDMSVGGNTIAGVGATGTGLALSSSWSCPVEANTFLLGANDTGVQVMKETDNPFAREQANAMIAHNTFRGDQATSLCFRLLAGSSHVQILGNQVFGANRFLLYQSGAIDTVLVADNMGKNVNTFEVRAVTPTNVTYRDNLGMVA